MGDGLSPYPFALSFPQDDHERLLVGKLEATGHTVEWGTELTRFREGATGVRAILVKGGHEESFECDYLCGCDGAHSRVREGTGTYFPGGSYDQLFFVADVKTADMATTDAFMNLGENAFVFCLPVRSSGMQRLIGVVMPGHAGQDFTFEDIRAEVEPLIGTRVETVNWFSTYHVHHRVADRFQVGRSFLVGDAGPVHSPAGGQGMNTGIGDAVNLAWKLADVARGRAAASLLETYEVERIAFARKLVATTDRAFQVMVGKGKVNRIWRTWLMPRLVPTLAALPGFRRALFETASQTRIKYRHSTLSAGRAGRVHGGDRLPWLPSGPDNFEPLRSLDWQVHVYGHPGETFAATLADLGLPLHSFDWRDAAEAAGFKRDAAYLVRPDGFVALALPDQDAASLRDFVRRTALAFQGGSHAQTARPRQAYPLPWSLCAVIGDTLSQGRDQRFAAGPGSLDGETTDRPAVVRPACPGGLLCNRLWARRRGADTDARARLALEPCLDDYAGRCSAAGGDTERAACRACNASGLQRPRARGQAAGQRGRAERLAGHSRQRDDRERHRAGPSAGDGQRPVVL